MFKASFKYKDAIFGTIEHDISGDEPYDLIYSFFNNFSLRAYLTEKTNIKFTHEKTGETKRFTINFLGADEDDFSMPVVVNEKKFEEWIKLVEPNWTGE
jgi:hypothetical protein